MIKESTRTDPTPARTPLFQVDLVPDDVNQAQSLLQILSKAGLISP